MSEQRMYRGNRVDSKGWAYGYYAVIVVDSIVYCYIIPATATGTINQGTGQKAIEGMIEVIATSVRQSTGRRDRDGVKIYEKDIVSLFGATLLYVIKWNERRARYFMESTIGTFKGDIHQVNLSKVIGNTTDNPELLEKQANE